MDAVQPDFEIIAKEHQQTTENLEELVGVAHEYDAGGDERSLSGFLLLGPTDAPPDAVRFETLWGQRAVIYRKRA